MPRAVICTRVGPYHDGLQLLDVPAAQLPPQPRQLVVDVLACGIAFPDVLSVMGKHISRPTPPFVLGSEVCGRVTAVGDGAEGTLPGVQVGSIVFGSATEGGVSQQAVLDASRAYLVPEGVDPHVAAGFELNYGTATGTTEFRYGEGSSCGRPNRP